MSPAFANEAAAPSPRGLPDPLTRLQAATAQFAALFEPLRVPGTGALLARLAGLERALYQRVMEPGGTALLLGESEAAKTRFLSGLLGDAPYSVAAESAPRVARSACTWITHGREPVALVTSARGRTTSLRPAQLPGYLANDFRGAAAQPIVLRSPSAALESGLVLIDAPPLTPDTLGFLERTADARTQANAILFLIEAGRAPTEATLRVLRSLRPRDFLFVIEAPQPDELQPGAATARRAAALELEERLAAFTLSQYGGVRDPQVVTLDPGRSQAVAGFSAHRALLERASSLWQSTAAYDTYETAEELVEHLDATLAGTGTAMGMRARLRAALADLRALEQQIIDAAAALVDVPVPLAGTTPPRPTLVPAPISAAPAKTAEAPAHPPHISPPAPNLAEPKVEVSNAEAQATKTSVGTKKTSATETEPLAIAAPQPSAFVRLGRSADVQHAASGERSLAFAADLLRFRPMALVAGALAVLCAVLLWMVLRPHSAPPASAPQPAPIVQSTPATPTVPKQAQPHRRRHSVRTHVKAGATPQ